jgi:hypothetical protein
MRTLSTLLVLAMITACGGDDVPVSEPAEPTADLAQDPPAVDPERPAAIEYEEQGLPEAFDTDTGEAPN